MNLFEPISPLEQEHTPENVENDMKDYVIGLKDVVREKQRELDNTQDNILIEKLTDELKEINTQIIELEETLEFMQEAGDELKIEIKEL